MVAIAKNGDLLSSKQSSTEGSGMNLSNVIDSLIESQSYLNFFSSTYTSEINLPVISSFQISKFLKIGSVTI